MSFKEKLAEHCFAPPKETLRPNEIPTVMVYGKSLPEVWENSVLAVWEYGAQIPTEYDQPVDPDSRDASLVMVIADPFAEPRIHASLPCALGDLEVYKEEVVEGIHNDLVKPDGWSYSYNDRLVDFPGRDGFRKIDEIAGGILLPPVDQIDVLIKKLSETPHSRRAQAVTWNPWVDSQHHEPPCLQRIWCRVVKSEEDLYLLEMNTHWRSRDIFKAAFMNMYAFTEWQRVIARGISDLSGRRVEVGRYVDMVDSAHIYGQYIRKGEIDRFIHATEKLPWEKRTFRSDDLRVVRAFAAVKADIRDEIALNILRITF